MRKDALFNNDPFSGSEKTARSSYLFFGKVRAFFGQDQVALLTKRQCNLSLMFSTSNHCERPAL